MITLGLVLAAVAGGYVIYYETTSPKPVKYFYDTPATKAVMSY